MQPFTQNLLLGLGAATLIDTPYLKVKRELEPILNRWGNGHLLRIESSGSYAKGTAVIGGSDVDIFCSVSSTVPNTLPQIYGTLAAALSSSGYNVRRQNVSVGIEVKGYKVDVTPGRRRDQNGNDHSLFSTKRGSWIQTDIAKQISYVRDSGRTEEIRWLKEWRNFMGLDWPSFHVEVFTITSLVGHRHGALRDNVFYVLCEIARGKITRRLLDPASTSNNLSDEIDSRAKVLIEMAANLKIKEFVV